MTLNAETPDLLLQSYASWATKVGFPHDFVRDTVSSEDMKIEEKIKNLRDLIETKIHLYPSWLLLVDQVISITSTHGLLPEPGNKHWGRGQLLMTTQDSLHIPPSSSLTSHVSIKKSMEPNDASRFLAMVSGITDHDMEDKVTKALDYQLAMTVWFITSGLSANLPHNFTNVVFVTSSLLYLWRPVWRQFRKMKF